jgi:hypothetical protein
MRVDNELRAHLAHFGIDVGTQHVTAKTMAELELVQSLAGAYCVFFCSVFRERSL